MIGLLLALLALVLLMVWLWRRPFTAIAGARYSAHRKRRSALIILGLAIGTATLAAAGIAGDSASESFRRSIDVQSGGADAIVDGTRLGLDPLLPLTAPDARRIVADQRVSSMIDDHSGAALKVDAEIAASSLAGRTMALWGVDPQSFGRILGWKDVEGHLPSALESWNPHEFVLNEQAAIELGLDTGDPIYLIVNRLSGFESSTVKDTYNQSGRLEFTAMNPALHDYVHSPADVYEFRFPLVPRSGQPNLADPDVLYVNASTDEEIDLHIQVISPNGRWENQTSPGPEASLAWTDPSPGNWTIRVHSPLAVDADVRINVTHLQRRLDYAETIVTYDGSVRAVIQTQGSDPLQRRAAAFLPRPAVQKILGLSDFTNVIIVDAKQGYDALELDSNLKAATNIVWGENAEVVVPLASHEARIIGNDIQDLLLVFSLFTLVSGVLLIFVIVALLMEDRKRTIAVLRAGGAQRVELTRLHVAEGAIYAAFAAVVGLAAGTLIVLVLSERLAHRAGVENLVFVLRPSTVLGAATVGLVLTLGVVAIAAHRIGHLDIPLALRGEEAGRRPRSLATRLRAALLAGTGLTFATIGWLADLSVTIYLGLVAATLGTLWIVWPPDTRRSLVLAMATSVVILSLVFLPALELDDPRNALLFPMQTLGFTLGASVLLAYAEPIHRLVATSSAWILRGRPVAEVALAHLRARPSRSAVVMAVLATVVLVSTTFVGLLAEGAAPMLGDAGGFDVLAQTHATITDPREHLDLYPPRSAHDPLSKSSILLSTPWAEQYSLHPSLLGRAEPLRSSTGLRFGDAIGVTPAFAQAATFRSAELAPGVADLPSALERLTRDQDVIIVADHMETASGRPLQIGDRVSIFGPDDQGTEPAVMEVITILQDSGAAGFYVNPAVLGTQGNQGTRLWAKTAPGERDADLGIALEGAFRSVAIDVIQVSNPHPERRAEAENLQSIIGVNLGIGVVVGIVGLGLLSIRGVLVRRREIATLRALGVTPRQITGVFAFESVYVTLAALSIGLMGAVLMAEALLADSDVLAASVIDWQALLPLYIGTIAAAATMAFATAWHAAKTDPVKGLRQAE